MASSSAPSERERQINLYRTIDTIASKSRWFTIPLTFWNGSQLIIKSMDVYNKSDIFYLQIDIVNNAVEAVGGLTVIAFSFLAQEYCKRKATRQRFDRDNSD